jgi:hypothetical protein
MGYKFAAVIIFDKGIVILYDWWIDEFVFIFIID